MTNFNRPSDFAAGDVVQYEDGRLDYLISFEGDLYVSGVNTDFLVTGRLPFAYYVEPFCSGYDEEDPYEWQTCRVVDHVGSGTVEDAERWFAEHEDEYYGQKQIDGFYRRGLLT